MQAIAVRGWLLSAFALCSPLFGGLQVAAAPQDAKVPLAAVDYFKDVRPILETRCYGCHGPKKQKADLRLDKKHSAFGEASDGLKVIRPGRSAESELFRRVTSDDPEVRMPPEEESLTPDQIGTLRTWIDRGAGWPGNPSGRERDVGSHWAFRPPHRPSEPTVRNTRWARNPIDRFILARLEAEGLSPSTEADKATLLRRLSLDLTGLPPSVEEVDAFVADTTVGAWTTAVDRLLASPHYGERWGRHWLDAAALCRLGRLRERQVALRMVLSRLGGQRTEPRPAL